MIDWLKRSERILRVGNLLNSNKLMLKFYEILYSSEAKLMAISLHPSRLDQIREKQKNDALVEKIWQKFKSGKPTKFKQFNNGILQFKEQSNVPKDAILQHTILSKAHSTPDSVPAGLTKMYHDLKTID